jgi:DNA-binding transcriptional MerR regulator
MNDEIANLHSLSVTPRYNIKAVVRQTQINISTLRAWEQRYGVPSPTRSDHGHRLYSARDIAIINWLKQATERGVTISQAVAMLRECEPTPHRVKTNELADLPISGGLSRLREYLIDAIDAVKLHRAHLLVNTACAMFPLETVILDLLAPVQRTVGERWERGHICIAEEHLATNFIRQRLFSLMQIHEPFAHGPRLICCCPPYEQHEIGLLMFTLLMQLHGWETIYLGQSLGIEGLGEFLGRLAPALVYTHITMVEHMSGMLDLCHLVKTFEPQRLTLAYGGRVFQQHPDLHQNIPGIFLGNDLREAVSRANGLSEKIDRERAQLRQRLVMHVD